MPCSSVRVVRSLRTAAVDSVAAFAMRRSSARISAISSTARLRIGLRRGSRGGSRAGGQRHWSASALALGATGCEVGSAGHATG